VEPRYPQGHAHPGRGKSSPLPKKSSARGLFLALMTSRRGEKQGPPSEYARRKNRRSRIQGREGSFAENRRASGGKQTEGNWLRKALAWGDAVSKRVG